MRPTFITGSASGPVLGTKSRDATIRIEDGVAVAETVKGARFDPWSVQWRTLRTVRVAAKAKVHQDGRFSANGPAMFAVPMASITNAKGVVMGRSYDFAAFVEHMLTVGDGRPFAGQTHEDRVNDAALVLTQESWSRD